MESVVKLATVPTRLTDCTPTLRLIVKRTTRVSTAPSIVTTSAQEVSMTVCVCRGDW